MLVRRGFRGDKFVALFKFKWNGSTTPGFLVRWLSPGDYLALAISASDCKSRLYKREADGALSTLATAALGYTLSSGTWYEGKIVIDDDPGNSALQQLRFWVDTDGDGDYTDETASITTTAVDDVWSAGYVGLYRTGGTVLQQFDDVKVGYDNDADGDIADAGDDIQVLDSFDSSVMSLTYDNNGNLTDDGVLRYVYDGWNRLVKAQRYADGDTTTIGEYRYLPDNRRASKVVSHAGVEAVAGDGGNATVHYYYASRWQILEARNGSNQATRQWVWGTQYVDEPLLMDVNGEPGTNNTCDPDVTDATSVKDRRYYCQQDRNWNVVALLEADDTQGTAGRCVERYAYTPYGEFIVLEGEGGSGNLGNALVASTVGNPLAHQGLPMDQEKASYHDGAAERSSERFLQRDGLASATRAAFSPRSGRIAFPGGLSYLTGIEDPQAEPGGHPWDSDCELRRGPAPPGFHWEGFYPTCRLVPNSSTPFDCFTRYGPLPPGQHYEVRDGRCVVVDTPSPPPDWQPVPFIQHVWGHCCGNDADHDCSGDRQPRPPVEGWGDPTQPDCVDAACKTHDQCISSTVGHTAGSPEEYIQSGQVACDCQFVSNMNACDAQGHPMAYGFREAFCRYIIMMGGTCAACPPHVQEMMGGGGVDN